MKLGQQYFGMSLTARKLLFPILLLTNLFLAGCVAAKNVVTRIPVAPASDGSCKAASNAGSSGLKMDGVVYALPRTKIIATVPVKLKTFTPGEFQKFAQCFFPYEEAIAVKSSTYSVGTPVFSTKGEADCEEVFIANIKGRYLEDKLMQLEFTDDNILAKGQAESNDQTLEFTMKAIKTGALIGATIVKTGAGVPFTLLRQDEPIEGRKRTSFDNFRESLSQRERRCWDEINHRLKTPPSAKDSFADLKKLLIESLEKKEALEEAKKTAKLDDLGNILAADQENIDKASASLAQAEIKFNNEAAKKIGEISIALKAEQEKDKPDENKIEALRKDLSEIDALYDLDNFKEAKLLFDKIRVLQGQRENLLSEPNSQLPKETLALMIEELEKQIAQFKASFLGSVTEPDPWNPAFEVLPSKTGSMIDDELFQYLAKDPATNKKGGICKMGDKFKHIVVPPALLASDVEGCKQAVPVHIQVTRNSASEGGQVADSIRGAKIDESGKRGFYYRVPGMALARIIIGKDASAREKKREGLLVAQFGITVSLPASTNGRKTKYGIELSPATGALKNFVLGTNSLVQLSALDDVKDASSSIVGTVSAIKQANEAKKTAAATASDELKQLERQRAILEEKIKIKQAEATLGKQP